MEQDAQRLAEAAAHALLARDHASEALGIKLLEIRPGYARMQMPVRRDMVNIHGTAHGGMLFTLADSAFGYACNTYDKVTVASGCSIDFLRPAHLGDVLTATAVEQTMVGRNGVYDVRIDNDKDELVALFRGKSIQIKGTVTEAESGG
ncbi:MAG: phenylacetic acid degradation protein PaaD [Betaproteobacteria bacterium RIFCSPLOWO2_12_FULL_63_13]|nr:MAG: phenylacetic acid degradation protein PaaD [Betaproteobacteria bacterium RIFCSPLOWO2_02_FULL_63_19]OGA53982.1 MAG: phenylacetic acid degradation protein PaaD [Betaproteobacteria bacterium RIFCSPLOWO2_12_FULL_63_13]